MAGHKEDISDIFERGASMNNERLEKCPKCKKEEWAIYNHDKQTTECKFCGFSLTDEDLFKWQSLITATLQKA